MIKAPCKLKLPIMFDFLVNVLHPSTKTTAEVLQIKFLHDFKNNGSLLPLYWLR